LFERHFGTKVDAWTVSDNVYGDYLNASSRFLTRTSDEPHAEPVDFGDGVDPHGFCKQFAGVGLIHTIDNVVKYYKLQDDSTAE
jgi:hypothetical protein